MTTTTDTTATPAHEHACFLDHDHHGPRRLCRCRCEAVLGADGGWVAMTSTRYVVTVTHPANITDDEAEQVDGDALAAAIECGGFITDAPEGTEFFVALHEADIPGEPPVMVGPYRPACPKCGAEFDEFQNIATVYDMRSGVEVTADRWIFNGYANYTDGDAGRVECGSCLTRIAVPEGVELDWA